MAIFESLSAFNGRRMNGRSLSRREQFEQIEAEYLRPLPAIRHQMKERRSATVMRNCYVTFKLHHYSMPKEYIGKRVENGHIQRFQRVENKLFDICIYCR